MGRLTVVMCSQEGGSLGAWNDELSRAGFDVALNPYPRYDDPRSVPIIVCGDEEVIEFEMVPATDRAPWFPLGMLMVREPRWVALFEWRDSNPYEEAAAHAAAAALAKIDKGVVFGPDGLRAELPPSAYRRAQALFAALPPRDQPA